MRGPAMGPSYRPIAPCLTCNAPPMGRFDWGRHVEEARVPDRANRALAPARKGLAWCAKTLGGDRAEASNSIDRGVVTNRVADSWALPRP